MMPLLGRPGNVPNAQDGYLPLARVQFTLEKYGAAHGVELFDAGRDIAEHVGQVKRTPVRFTHFGYIGPDFRGEVFVFWNGYSCRHDVSPLLNVEGNRPAAVNPPE